LDDEARWSHERSLSRPSRPDEEGLFRDKLNESNRPLSDSRDFLTQLLQATRPRPSRYSEDYRQLWTREAIYRARILLDLFLLIETENWLKEGPTIRSCLDQARASTLLDLYQSLEVPETSKLVPCTPILRGITEGIVELFSRAVGDLKVDHDLISLSLNSIKRRALVLVVSELTLDFISEAFGRRGNGTIYVRLEKHHANAARLTVDSNGSLLRQQRLEDSLPIVAQLVNVIEGEIIIKKSPFGGHRFEVDFPIIK
jgi:hypothetical protein